MLELRAQLQPVDRAAVPGERDHEAVRTDRADRGVQGRRSSGRVDHDVGASPSRVLEHGPGHVVGRLQHHVRARLERELAPQRDVIDADHEPSARTAQKPGHEQSDHAEPRYHDDVTEVRVGVEDAVQRRREVRVEDAAPDVGERRQADQALLGDHVPGAVRLIAEHRLAHQRLPRAGPGGDHGAHVRVAVDERVRPLGLVGDEEVRPAVLAPPPLGREAPVHVQLGAGTDTRADRLDEHLARAWTGDRLVAEPDLAGPGDDHGRVASHAGHPQPLRGSPSG